MASVGIGSQPSSRRGNADVRAAALRVVGRQRLMRDADRVRGDGGQGFYQFRDGQLMLIRGNLHVGADVHPLAEYEQSAAQVRAMGWAGLSSATITASAPAYQGTMLPRRS
jgi:hypothetical protein